MKPIRTSIAEFFADERSGGWGDERHDLRRRAALTALFASLPSRRMDENERKAQLATYAGELDDLPPEALESVVRKFLRSTESPWLPSIGQLRHATAKAIRELRYRVTGASTANDYDPERGVVFDADAEIRWARTNAAALIQGKPFPQVASGLHRNHIDGARLYPSALPQLTEGKR